jgi:hypothetical protein
MSGGNSWLLLPLNVISALQQVGRFYLVKSRKPGYAGHVDRMQETRNVE